MCFFLIIVLQVCLINNLFNSVKRRYIDETHQLNLHVQFLINFFYSGVVYCGWSQFCQFAVVNTLGVNQRLKPA